MSSNYCALKKLTNVDDAFRYMAGEYYLPGDSASEFSILNDESFPKYFLSNAISVIAQLYDKGYTEKRIDSSISMDKNGFVDVGFLAFPFMLWSKKLQAFYCHHFDTDYEDVTDEEFCEALSELIDAYDLPAIMQKAKMIVKAKRKELSKDFDDVLVKLCLKLGVGLRRLDFDEV